MGGSGQHACGGRGGGHHSQPTLLRPSPSPPIPPAQIEFYFSDSNLPRDKFLQEKVAQSPDGYVDLPLLCIFTRVASLLHLTTRDPKAVPAASVADVADALEGSDVLALSEDRQRVRRAAELRASDEVAAEVDARSLYASPFPFDTTLDALTAFFAHHARVNCVRMRRHLTSKDFKGSVFVEFATKEEAERVAGMQLEHEGAVVQLEPKLEFVKRKEEERQARPAPAAAAPAAKPAKPAAKPAGGKRKAEAEPEAAEEGEGGGDGEAAEGEGAAGEAHVPTYDPGCVVHFDFGECEFSTPPTFGLVKDTFGGREQGLLYVDYEQASGGGAVKRVRQVLH